MSSRSVSLSNIGWRVTFLESSEGLLIKILTPKRLTTITTLLVILVGCGFVIIASSKSTVNLNLICLGIGIILFPLCALLWNIVGKELVTISKNKIVVKQAVFGIGFKQTYQLSLVSNLRASLTNPAMFTLENNLHEWGFAGGSVAFDYNGRICRFGLLISKEDADALVTKINQYLLISSSFTP